MKSYQNIALRKIKGVYQKIGNEPELKESKEFLKDIIYILERKKTSSKERVINSFCSIANVLDELPLMDAEKMRLFFDIIKVNLKILSYNYDILVINEEIISLFKKENLDLDKLSSLLENTKDEKEKKEIIRLHYPLHYDIIINTLWNNRQVLSAIQESYLKLKENYYDNKGYILEEEYNVIINVLEKLMIPQNLLELLKKELKKVIITKRDTLPTEKIEVLSKDLWKKTTQTKNTLSKQEAYQLRRRVLKYYNIDMNEEVKECNPLEKIELIMALTKLNYRAVEIQKILKQIDRKYRNQKLNLFENNPMKNGILLNTIVKKLKHCQMEKQLQEMKDLLYMIKLSSNLEEKNEWKSELFSLMNLSYSEIPFDNQFEMDMAEKQMMRSKK